MNNELVVPVVDGYVTVNDSAEASGTRCRLYVQAGVTSVPRADDTGTVRGFVREHYLR